MIITLFQLRQWIFASAGLGSLLVASLPSAFADGPEMQFAADPYSSYLHQFPRSSEPSYAENDSRGMEHTQSDHPSPMAQRNVKPGHAVLPPPGTLGKTYSRTPWPIPLLPGAGHIYRVKACYWEKEPHWEVRTVRLIPGRVVTLEF